MSVIRYRDYHPLAPLQPHELRYLRESLGWSQAKMGSFLGKTKVTVHRWEQGQFAPDDVTLGALHRLWYEVFGDYEGPYKNMYAGQEPAPAPLVAADKLATVAQALLIGGVAFFLAKGIMVSDDE